MAVPPSCEEIGLGKGNCRLLRRAVLIGPPLTVLRPLESGVVLNFFTAPGSSSRTEGFILPADRFMPRNSRREEKA